MQMIEELNGKDVIHKILNSKHSTFTIVTTLSARIEDMKAEKLLMDSVMYGIMLGLIEARDLILEQNDD